MSPRLLIIPLVVAFAASCSKDADEAKNKPAYEPGPKVDKQLAQIGGVTLSAPDNLKISESEGSAKLEAEGFPTITITQAKGEGNGTGTRTKTSMGDVRVIYSIPTTEWTCAAKDVGDHEKLVIEICESLSAPENPNVSAMVCKTVDAFDAEPVGKAWSDTAAGFTSCLARLDRSGFSFGFNFELDAGSRNFTKYTSPTLDDAEASKCLDAIYEELRKSPAFTKEGVETGQIECDGSYSRY